LAGDAEGAGVALERPALENMALDKQHEAREQGLTSAPDHWKE
jgi:hypothetical protein